MGCEQRADCIHLVPTSVPGADSRGPDAAKMSTRPNPNPVLAPGAAIGRPGAISANRPLILLPVHIQTRFVDPVTDGRKQAPELWIRIYPDQVAVNSHEPELTNQEVADGK